MSDIQKAIGTLNVMESTYSHIRKNDNEFEAIEAAKEALQDQAEREKECGYKQTCGWCSLFDRPCDEVCNRHLRKPVEK